MSKFNVIKDPWINVVEQGEIKVVGIRELFENAHKYEAISENSPLVEYGIYRLLVAFLMDIYEPADIDELIDMVEEGKFDMDKFDTYVYECEKEGNCFDLFDSEMPFLQFKHSGSENEVAKPVESMIFEMPSGNNAPIYYSKDLKEFKISFAEAAKYLCTMNGFSTAMSGGYPSTVNGAPPYYFIIHGDNLFETLVINSVDKSNEIAKIGYNSPRAAWRSKNDLRDNEVSTTSVIGALTLRPRRITLISDENSETVSKIWMGPGENYTGYSLWRDPHVALREGKEGYTNIKPSEHKEVWQELGVIFDRGAKVTLEPITLNNLIQIKGERGIVNTTVYGVITNKASYKNTIRENITIPTNIIADNEKTQCFVECIKWVELVSAEIRSGIKNIDKSKFLRKAKVKLFSDITNEIAEGDFSDEKQVNEIYNNWKEFLYKSAIETYNENILVNDLNATKLKQYSLEQKGLRHRLNRLLKRGE